MIRDFCAFSALAVFLYGLGLVALAIDPPKSNHTAIVAASERN